MPTGFNTRRSNYPKDLHFDNVFWIYLIESVAKIIKRSCHTWKLFNELTHGNYKPKSAGANQTGSAKCVTRNCRTFSSNARAEVRDFLFVLRVQIRVLNILGCFNLNISRIKRGWKFHCNHFLPMKLSFVGMKSVKSARASCHSKAGGATLSAPEKLSRQFALADEVTSLPLSRR